MELALVLAVVGLVLAVVALTIGGRQGSRGRRGPRGATGPDGQAYTGPALDFYLSIEAFAQSFIQIPTSNVASDSLTIASSYLAGRAPLYGTGGVDAGTCSASFLNMQTADGIFTDISNYIATPDGLTTTLLNLELDTLINGMVTEALVTVTTKVGASAYFGQTFDLTVSSDGENIHFNFAPPTSS